MILEALVDQGALFGIPFEWRERERVLQASGDELGVTSRVSHRPAAQLRGEQGGAAHALDAADAHRVGGDVVAHLLVGEAFRVTGLRERILIERHGKRFRQSEIGVGHVD